MTTEPFAEPVPPCGDGVETVPFRRFAARVLAVPALFLACAAAVALSGRPPSVPDGRADDVAAFAAAAREAPGRPAGYAYPAPGSGLPYWRKATGPAVASVSPLSEAAPLR